MSKLVQLLPQELLKRPSAGHFDTQNLDCRHLNKADVSAPVQQELRQLAAALAAGDGAAAKRVQVGLRTPDPEHEEVNRARGRDSREGMARAGKGAHVEM